MKQAVFTQGSTLKHILIMTGANTVGLITLFTVDLIDIYFLSLLGQEKMAAAVGFASALLFFMTSLSIGLQIAMGALVARAEGRNDRALAGRYCSNVMLFSALIAAALCFPVWLFAEQLLRFLGAQGHTLALALSYCNILLPATPLLAVGMCAAASLRALGDARRAMYATMGGALINAVLDPIFIFACGWGIEGAAMASFAARIGVFTLAVMAIVKVHKLPSKTNKAFFKADLAAIGAIAGPAVLTNVATPIGSSYVLKMMAEFGDSAVAGAAIIGRIAPVAFVALFALSGAIGPIIGQNAGAGRYDRVRQVVWNAMLSNLVYVLLIWGLLFLLSDSLVVFFRVDGDAAALIGFYNYYLAGGFVFGGMLFIANASFNNLHRAYFATLLNFGRALLGTVPLVYLLSQWFGAKGVIAGEVGGAAVFGVLGFSLVLWHISRLEKAEQASI
ncbi:MATE family efflux transporter [Dasania sp. GY-MA-18]|uniref:Multidrug-efflux transporter n=1 Tax=Dasania phycosphaerae TaxID=2950436 RepID=A0A9J6RR50_9GAMM|nr:MULTISPECIES: MATE family efflux transporter [Dasania]MCR8924067.1 MATE family efflux transporter [Dasania sp. GY-MA-18]MCZ0866640.1 MATE family efflux transporter [Dasania phycosphaerae]MCZ0870225.1 MATE family efflux transporter [Dasania phycosphaerae]